MSVLSERLASSAGRGTATAGPGAARRAWFFLGVALVAGLAAASLMRAQMMDRPTATAVPTVPVLVAASDVTALAALRAQDLSLIEWPASSAPPGVISDPTAAVGRILKTGLVKGELVLPAKLAESGVRGGLAASLAESMRAVSVRVDDVSGVSGFLLPGDLVDVIATMKADEKPETPETAKVVLQRVRVLALGRETARPEAPQSTISATVATLAVSPHESEALALVSGRGRLLLALRRETDLAPVTTEGAIPARMLEPPPSPPRIARGPVRRDGARLVHRHVVEILRGGKRERREFVGEARP